MGCLVLSWRVNTMDCSLLSNLQQLKQQSVVSLRPDGLRRYNGLMFTLQLTAAQTVVHRIFKTRWIAKMQ
jgi:hypothetical protein